MIRIPPTFTATSGTLHFFYKITKNAFGETIRKKEKILTFTTLADIMIVGSALIMTVPWNATLVDLENKIVIEYDKYEAYVFCFIHLHLNAIRENNIRSDTGIT